MKVPPPEARCSALSLQADESLAGSAPHAVAWVGLEQNGPWGAKAFTSSHLDPVLGAALESAATVAGVRPCLVRRPGRHADSSRSGPRRVLVAFTKPQGTWLLTGTVDDPEQLTSLDWAAVAVGDASAVRRSLPVLSEDDRPHLLVCTNGTRDVCCATLGRPVAVEAAAGRPEQVWEVTHTSGHRFAPTAVLLPHGTLHGRLDGARAVQLLDAAGRGETVLAGHRGRSTWPPPAQVAELAVRERTGELRLDALSVVRRGEHWQVRGADGAEWAVQVDRVASGVERPESCGKGAVELVRYRATVAEPGAGLNPGAPR
jgi:hypothetical protein